MGTFHQGSAMESDRQEQNLDLDEVVSDTCSNSDQISKHQNECTLNKILSGDYLTDLYILSKQLGYTDAHAKEKLTDNAYDCVAKATNLRQPLEQNLILSILFKVFS